MYYDMHPQPPSRNSTSSGKREVHQVNVCAGLTFSATGYVLYIEYSSLYAVSLCFMWIKFSGWCRQFMSVLYLPLTFSLTNEFRKFFCSLVALISSHYTWVCTKYSYIYIKHYAEGMNIVSAFLYFLCIFSKLFTFHQVCRYLYTPIYRSYSYVHKWLSFQLYIYHNIISY